MNEIDWSKAPEGATHYNHTYFDWYKVGSHEPFFWDGRAWAPARLWDDRKHDCIQRPAAPSWSGEGLPPVGVVCEFVDEDDCDIRPPSWPDSLTHGAGVEILAHYAPLRDSVLVAVFAFKIDSGRATAQAMAGCFRPLRTPEQIAADAREQALQAACDVVGCQVGSMYGVEVVKKQIDAGYRKP